MVIRSPNNPIPIEATPIARRYGGLPEAGPTVVMRPKMRMARPMIVSEIHQLLNRTLALVVSLDQLVYVVYRSHLELTSIGEAASFP